MQRLDSAVDHSAEKFGIDIAPAMNDMRAVFKAVVYIIILRIAAVLKDSLHLGGDRLAVIVTARI